MTIISLVVLCILYVAIGLPLPAKVWCTDSSVPFSECGLGGRGIRMMEELTNIPVAIPAWWEQMKPQQRKCPNCTVIWLLCPFEDTGAWDGGDMLRLGSRMMLEIINEQQWLLPGYELMCETYNDGCEPDIGNKIIINRLTANPKKYVGVGGVGCSKVNVDMAQYPYFWKVPHMSWAAGTPALSERTKYLNFFRTRIPRSGLKFVYTAIAKLLGWEKLVVIQGDRATWREQAQSIAAELRFNGKEVEYEVIQVLNTKQIDSSVGRIKQRRNRIIVLVDYETLWRALLCSAYVQGIVDLLWMVFDFFSNTFYSVDNDPDLSPWLGCQKAKIREMADNSLHVGTVMWAADESLPLFCDRADQWTAKLFREQYLELAASELSSENVTSRGGRDYRITYPREAGAQAADGACVYAIVLSKLLGLHPLGEATFSGKTFTLAQVLDRSEDVYEEAMQLMQHVSFNGVSGSPFSFDCPGLPRNGSPCDHACRNAPSCTGDGAGAYIIEQMNTSAPEGPSEFRKIATYDPIRPEADQYIWFNKISFQRGSFYGGIAAESQTTAPSCHIGYHLVGGSYKYCVLDDLAPRCPSGQTMISGSCEMCSSQTYDSGSACRSCPVGKMQELEGQTKCDYCPKGKFSNLSVGTCTDCIPGSFAAGEGLSECSLCAIGLYSASFGSISCDPCVAGSYAEAEGRSTCRECRAGKHAREMALSNCLECSEGKFSEQPGQAQCFACAVGSYTSIQGSPICIPCPPHMTTMVSLQVHGAYEWILVNGATNSSSCRCQFGYRAHGDTCVACLAQGMSCEGEAQIEPGYYANFDYSLFECRPSNRCKGGSAGHTCEIGRTGIACAECERGMTPHQGGKCIRCEGADVAPIIICVICVMVSIVLVYGLVDSRNLAEVSHSMMMVGIAAGQLVAIVQLLSVIATFSVPFPDPLDTIFSYMNIFAFDLYFLRPNCLATTTPVRLYTMRIVMIVVLSLIVVVVHCIVVSFRYKGRFKERKSTLVAVQGLLCTVFYISVITTVIAPLQCEKHPNGEWTVRSYGSVLCWESRDASKHTLMVVIGLSALVFPLGYLAVCAQIVYQFPSRMHKMDTEYLKAYSFLFLRVKPDCYWYSLLTLMRSLACALMPIVPIPAVQISLLQTVLLALLMVTVWCKPWRVALNNYFEMTSNVMLLLLLSLGMVFLRDKDTDVSAVAWACTIGLVGIFAGILCLMSYGLYRAFTPGSKVYQFFISHHKQAAGAYARVLKMFLIDQSQVRRKVFLDSDDLQNLDGLFQTVGSDVECLVILASRSIYIRPWCLGEIVMAHVHHVRVRVVQMPDTAELTAQSISDYINTCKSNGMEALAPSGIDINMIECALKWVMSRPMFVLPREVNSAIVVALATELVKKMNRSLSNGTCEPVIIGAIEERATHGDRIIICDTEIVEISASALILRKMLLACQLDILVMTQQERFPSSVRQCVALFDSECLERPVLPRFLILAVRSNLTILPLLLNEGFRVPSAVTLQELRDRSPIPEFEAEPGELAAAVEKIFSAIAKEFPVNMASEALLISISKQIAERLEALSYDMVGVSSMVGELSSSWHVGFRRDSDNNNVVEAPCRPQSEMKLLSEPSSSTVIGI